MDETGPAVSYEATKSLHVTDSQEQTPKMMPDAIEYGIMAQDNLESETERRGERGETLQQVKPTRARGMNKLKLTRHILQRQNDTFFKRQTNIKVVYNNSASKGDIDTELGEFFADKLAIIEMITRADRRKSSLIEYLSSEAEVEVNNQIDIPISHRRQQFYKYLRDARMQRPYRVQTEKEGSENIK